MPEGEFRKEADGKTYLLLKKTKEAYEEQMIQKNAISGVLPMVRPEQADVYKYEITGKKNLAMTFERVPMNAEQVERVLRSILDTLERGREYLLSEDNFILYPDQIYLRIPEYEVTLCYYPEYSVPFAEQLGKLFEMLLNRVDYREEKAIAMVYALYMRLREPDMTLERIREALEEQTSVQVNVKQKQEKEKEEEKTAVFREKETGNGVYGFVNPEEKFYGGAREEKKGGFWERLRKEVEIRRSVLKEKSAPAMHPVSCVREESPPWEIHQTKVLSVKKTGKCPALLCQRNGEVVYINKFPFYVGSLSAYADYTVERETVSRFHAKFEKGERGIFITDLNSTNGTVVNGTMLSVWEPVPVGDGDRILFADEEYVFLEKEMM